MPGIGGPAMVRAIREEAPDLPVLFMSGYTSGPAPGGQELPADAPLLYKPFQTDQLLTALHHLLHR
jgi:CheY-like chemotaxis protein